MGVGGTLQINLLGGFRVFNTDTQLPPIPSRRATSLLAYVVVNRNVRHTRDRLAGMFWPELDETQARRRLSQALWQIQNAAADSLPGQRLLVTSANEISVASDVEIVVDVHEFERLIESSTRYHHQPETAEALMVQAVELYDGDFMSGTYDDWLLSHQTRLRDMYVDCLSHISRLRRSRGAYHEALSLARQVAIHTPLREAAHRDVMRLEALLGRFPEAVEQFEECKEILWRELAVEPSEATTWLYEEIRQLAMDSPSTQGSSSPEPTRLDESAPQLVGRAEERAQIVEAFDEAFSGTGRVFLVEGPAGIGKTRLLTELARDAEWRGLSVLSIQCQPEIWGGVGGPVLGELEPFLTAARAAHLKNTLNEPWTTEIYRLLPHLSGVTRPPPLLNGSTEDRGEIINETIAQVIVACATLQPLVVFIDDIHWAKSDTYRLMELLASRTKHVPLVLVVGYRAADARADSSIWEHLLRLDRSHQPTRLELKPLSLKHSFELSRRWSRHRPLSPEVTESAVRETAGNPLFLLETLRELSERDLASFDQPDVTNLPIPASVEEVIVRRVELLAHDERELLAATAVVGGQLSLDELAAATGKTTASLAPAVVTLSSKGFLTEDHQLFSISHPQVRAVIVETLDSGSRAACHRGYAQWLDDHRPHDYQVRGIHHRGAGNHANAARWFEAAGDETLALGAHENALALFQQCLTGKGNGLSTDVLFKIESAANVTGNRRAQEDALSLLSDLRGVTVTQAVMTDIRKAAFLAHTGELATAQATIRDVIDVTETLGRLTPVLADVYMTSAAIDQLAGNHVRALDTLETAYHMQPDGPHTAEIITKTADSLRVLGMYVECRRKLDAAFGQFSELGVHRRAAEILGIRGSLQMEIGEHEEALATQVQCADLCRKIGFRRGLAMSLVNTANISATVGKLGPALGALDEASAIFNEIADPGGVARAAANAASIQVDLCGNWQLAQPLVSDAFAYFESASDYIGMTQCLGIRAAGALLSGRKEEAERIGLQAAEMATLTGRPWATDQAHLLLLRINLAQDRPIHVVDSLSSYARDGGRLDLTFVQALLATDERTRADEILSDIDPAKLSTFDQAHRFQLKTELSIITGDLPAAQRSSSAAASLVDRILSSVDGPIEFHARAAVPLFRQIGQAYVRLCDVYGTTLAVRAGTPLGRAPRTSETIEVSVHISEPQDFMIEDESERRRHQLLRITQELESAELRASIPQLAELLSVSVSTVRRDIQALRSLDISVSTRGAKSAKN